MYIDGETDDIQKTLAAAGETKKKFLPYKEFTRLLWQDNSVLL